ncbi:MAG: hypothetical protein SGJ05_00005, partial [bacterium]|nr:hypothetical protein [bacterium]
MSAAKDKKRSRRSSKSEPTATISYGSKITGIGFERDGDIIIWDPWTYSPVNPAARAREILAVAKEKRTAKLLAAKNAAVKKVAVKKVAAKKGAAKKV